MFELALHAVGTGRNVSVLEALQAFLLFSTTLSPATLR